MNKPLLVFQAPVATRSGYGDHSRDILRTIFDMDKYDVKVVPTRWGNTPQNELDDDTAFNKKVLNSIVPAIDRIPDVYIQITVSNEFRRVGKFNIGITAGVETSVVPKEFIDGCNKMDLIITPSEFTKDVLEQTRLQEVNRRTNQVVRDIKLEKPVEVIFEGVDTDIFTGVQSTNDVLKDISTSWNYLFVGHWLQGKLGEDRKDVGMMIQTFATVFKNIPKDKQPGLILKSSRAGFSVMEREALVKSIKGVTDSFGDKCPPIYLVFGDLTPEQMNDLYTDEKVKAMVMFTKGEGYGRPLAEFATTGKPILVSDWSGHKDFLPSSMTEYLDGEVKEVHESAQNQFIIKGSKWFTVNYSNAAKKILDVYQNYEKYTEKSQGLSNHIKQNFSLNKMGKTFEEVFTKYIKVPEKVELKLPEIKKL